MNNKIAIKLSNVSKNYKLFDHPQDRLIEQLGLSRFMFWTDRFRNVSVHRALSGLSLEVRKGERVGVVGSNGAGKTTLLKLIMGNFAPSSGTVEVNGTVQALMQLGLGFHMEFSGFENIKSALVYNGLHGTEFDNALHDVINFVELGTYLHQPMKTYSLGMSSRVQFAAATAIRPDILLIDEILGAGDSYFSAKSALRMRRLASSGCTIILVSHSWQQIQLYCDRVIWIDCGNVRMDGTAYEVLAAYEASMSEKTAALFRDKGELPKDDRIAVAESGNTAPIPKQDLAAIPWIANALREQEGISTSDESVDYLEDGQRVFRARGRGGLTFKRIVVTSNGRRTLSAKTGGDLTINMTLVATSEGAYRCTYWIHFFSLDGRRVCRIESQIDSFFLGAQKARTVEIRLKPLLIGGGDYLLSFSVFDVSSTNSAADTLSTRMEMLARSYQLRVDSENDSDPPAIHYPALWKFGGSQEWVQSIIQGGVR